MKPLNAREQKVLNCIRTDRKDFQVSGEFSGIGEATFESLERRGLVERGASCRHHGAMGWKLTDAGVQFIFNE